MASLLKTYSPKDVEITFNGKNINSGIAPDTFLTVSRDEDAFAKTVGADGTVARTRNANKSGSIELTLMQNSEIHKKLMILAAADEASKGEVIGAFAVKDPSDVTGTWLMVAAKCWIKKVPDMEYGKEYGTRTWLFDVAELGIVANLS